MKTFRNAIIIFFLFFLGTTAIIHVDRQCAQMDGRDPAIVETLENTIEKYGSLL